MEELLEFLHEKRLESWIDTFKDILNKMMCCTIDVEYMGIKKQIYI